MRGRASPRHFQLRHLLQRRPSTSHGNLNRNRPRLTQGCRPCRGRQCPFGSTAVSAGDVVLASHGLTFADVLDERHAAELIGRRFQTLTGCNLRPFPEKSEPPGLYLLSSFPKGCVTLPCHSECGQSFGYL